MHKFDTKIQYLKYKAVKQVAIHAWKDDLLENVLNIPKEIIPGKIPTMRCCVYKERAILTERVRLAMGGNGKNPNVIEVIDIACDECPAAGYQITDSCRGCLAHHCIEVCPRGAIYVDHDRRCRIDKDKCIECGKCASVCPYTAIISRQRPCMVACKVKAISINESGSAQIDNDKCIECGSCMNQCPFGAISEKSFILNVIDMINKSNGGTKYPVYAIIAPALSTQFIYAKHGQVLTAIKKLGFNQVFEVAQGADMVAYKETEELAEKGFLTSSCCPAFVSYIKKTYPDLVPFISSNLSPMATLAKYMKEQDPECKIVFIGPCTAKKSEIRQPHLKDIIDSVITFEELLALFDSKNINPEELEETELDNASYFGRIFARSRGLTDAIAQAVKEQNIRDFEFKPVVCDGIDQCKVALMKKLKGLLDGNFIEGMVCPGGCVGGAGILTRAISPEKQKASAESYGKEASTKTITDSINSLPNLKR